MQYTLIKTEPKGIEVMFVCFNINPNKPGWFIKRNKQNKIKVVQIESARLSVGHYFIQ